MFLLPAACLFYLDQCITVRVTNAPAHKLKKGPGYHLDMMVLAFLTFVCSIFGLPFMCAGTIQSLNHVKSVTTYSQVRDASGALTGEERVSSVSENRVTGFAIHGLVLSSLLLLPLLRQIPMAVITGVFLYLGTNMFSGNEFLARIPVMFMDATRLPKWVPSVPISQTNKFTILQVACLGMLWAMKLNKATAIYFPSMIASLMVIRSVIAPRVFSSKTLDALDASVVADDSSDTECDDSNNPPQLASQS